MPTWWDLSDRISVIRLIGAVLAAQHDEWIDGCRYLSLDVLSWSRPSVITCDDTAQEVIPALQAIMA